MRSSIVVVVAALGAWVLTPAVQKPQVPAFRGRVDLVTLDVSVWDRDHRPVKELPLSDFSLLEDGKPREIVTFSEFDIPDPPPPTAPWMRTVTTDVESNDVTDKRLFLILVDDASFGDLTLFATRREQIKAAARAVITRLGPTDLAAVVFTGDNRRSQDFTADHGRLLAAVDQMQGVSLPRFPVYVGRAPGSSGVGAGSLPGDKAPSEAENSLADVYSVHVLERAVEALIGAPGRRKALIDITRFSMHMAGVSHLKTRTEVMFEKAQRAGVNVYTMGPQVTRSPDYWEGSWFRRVAKETGGEWFGNLFTDSRAAERAATKIFLANSSYYVLAYSSDDLAKFHTIKVLVNRPDVTVRTREKYYWPGTPVGDAGAPEPPPLVKAIVEVLPNASIPMRVVAMPFATRGEAGATIAIATELRLTPLGPGGPADETIDLRTHLFTAEGDARGSVTTSVDVPTAGREFETEALSAITATKPALYQVRMAAHRAAAKVNGSVYATVDVPDFAKRAVSFSGAVVSIEDWPMLGPREALADLLPAVPTALRAFRATDEVRVFVRVYQASGRRPVAVPVRIRLIDDHDRTVLDRVESVAGSRFSESNSADVRVELPTATLSAGSYLLTFETAVGRTTARRDVRFSIKTP
jgi:VWFA-related protein